jgi:hypothetical protein
MYSQGYATSYLLSLLDNESNQRLKITKNPLIISYYEWIIKLSNKSGFPDVRKLEAKEISKLKITDSLILSMEREIKNNTYGNNNPQIVWDIETDRNILSIPDKSRTDLHYFVYPAYQSIHNYGLAYPNDIEIGLNRWQNYFSELGGYEIGMSQDNLKKTVLKLHDFLPENSLDSLTVNQLFIFLKQINEAIPIGLVFNDFSLKLDKNKKLIFELPFYPEKNSM